MATSGTAERERSRGHFPLHSGHGLRQRKANTYGVDHRGSHKQTGLGSQWPGNCPGFGVGGWGPTSMKGWVSDGGDEQGQLEMEGQEGKEDTLFVIKRHGQVVPWVVMELHVNSKERQELNQCVWAESLMFSVQTIHYASGTSNKVFTRGAVLLIPWTGPSAYWELGLNLTCGRFWPDNIKVWETEVTWGFGFGWISQF